MKFEKNEEAVLRINTTLTMFIIIFIISFLITIVVFNDTIISESLKENKTISISSEDKIQWEYVADFPEKKGIYKMTDPTDESHVCYYAKDMSGLYTGSLSCIGI